jgi:hypothetical protein
VSFDFFYVFFSSISTFFYYFFQPGKFFFLKGTSESEITLNSFSLEYLLLIQEKARIDVTLIPFHFRKSLFLALILFPLFTVRFLFLFIRLIILNQIIKSYLNSHEIKQLLVEKYENNNT